MNIKTKLTITTIVVFMLMVVLIGFIFFSVMRTSLESSAELEAEQSCNEAVFAIEKNIFSEINAVNTIAFRKSIVSKQNQIADKIESLQENISLIGYEYILLIWNNECYKVTENSFSTSRLETKKKLNYTGSAAVLYGSLFKNEEEGILISHPIYNDKKMLGSIVVKRPATWLWTGMVSSYSLSDKNIIVTKPKGEIVYPVDLAGSFAHFDTEQEAEIMTLVKIDDKDNKGSYAISILAEDISLYVTSYINLENIDDSLNNYVFFYIIIALASILIIAVIVYFFSYLMTKSIEELSEYAKQSQTKISPMPEKFFKRNDEAGALSRSFSILMNKLISSIKEKENMAYHDSLTGLKNRYKMEKDITNLLLKQKAFAFALLDIDDFKLINDAYGHAEGDLVLANIASIFKRTASNDFEIYRWGGDEFALIIYGQSEKEHRAVLDKIMHEINNSLNPYEDRRITISIGVCQYPDCADAYKSLLIAADIALAKAKSEGKNRYSFYDEK